MTTFSNKLQTVDKLIDSEIETPAVPFLWSNIDSSEEKHEVPQSSETKEHSKSTVDEFLPEKLFKLKPEQSYKKETKASRLGKSTGRWTQKEHLLFIEGLKIHGKNWKKIENFIGTRTGTQIRSHAQKFFNRIRKECNTEDPSKYVIDNMGDEKIRKIIMEDCDENVSNSNEENNYEEDTPEVLFSITKEKVDKKSKEDIDESPKSISATTSAFKIYKREIVEPSSSKEDSKIYSNNVTLKRPICNRPVIHQTPTLNNFSNLLSGMNQTAPINKPQLPFDYRSMLLQAILNGNSINQINLPTAQNLNNTVMNLLMTLALKPSTTF